MKGIDMINIIKRMKEASHYAAQEILVNEDYSRREILTLLESAKFGRFLLSKNLVLSPSAYGQIGDALNWTAWAVWNRKEVEAYSKEYELDLFRQPTCENNVCPKCGQYLGTRYNHLHCCACDEWYESASDIEENLIDVLTTWGEFCNGVGASYADKPFLKCGRNRIFIRWSGGKDI